MSFRYKVGCLRRLALIVMPALTALCRAVIEQIRYIVRRVCAQGNRCRMIRKHHHAEILSCLRKSLGDRPDNALIQALDRLYLLLNAALVSHLIRSFQMHVDKVISVLRQDI